MDDFAALDATAQAELVRTGAASPSELLDAALARIDRLNPELNAVIHHLDDRAREQVAAGPADGPFRGVPFLLKDFAAEYEGTPFHEGSDFAGDYVSTENQELTDRFLAAGLVICGKTNTPEFAILPTTEPRRHGATRNPWDISRTPGGSSGGSAAAVASGMVPVAHANDGGGSIRIPAACCGLVGLKPTRARVPLGPAFGDIMGGLVAEHVVSRSVRDSAALLDAVAGPMPGDPYAAPALDGTCLDAASADPESLRIAVVTRSFTDEPVDAVCARGAEQAGALCESLGHHVEADAFTVAETYVEHFINVWAAGNAAVLAWWEDAVGRTAEPDDLEALTWALVEFGRGLGADQYLRSVEVLQVESRRVAEFFETYDVLITPTLGEPPVPLGTFDSAPDEPLAGLFRSAEFVPFTPLFNVTGQPAVSLPLHWSEAGLPIGVQLVGKAWGEAEMIRLAAQLEEAMPWRDRRPPID
jgi:amidase